MVCFEAHSPFTAVQVDAQAQKDYSSGWTPQEYADRLWGVHLRFFPVVSPVKPVAVREVSLCTSAQRPACPNDLPDSEDVPVCSTSNSVLPWPGHPLLPDYEILLWIAGLP